MKKIMLCLLCTCLSFVCGCGMIGGKKEPIPSEGDLRRAYNKSKEDFKSIYEGKEVSVWGKTGLVDIDTGLVSFEPDASSDVSGAPSVMCYAEKADRQKFSDMHVKSGDMVRLKGILTVEAGTMKLSNCKLDKFGLSAVSDD